MTDTGVEDYLRYARPLLAEKDPAHGLAHVQRIFGRLDELAAGLDPQPDPDRLAFLACFHPLARLLREDGERRAQVRDLLTGRGWSRATIDDALAALDRHATRPETVEERIVHDANALEVLGALGVAKAFTTGGAHGQTLEETARVLAGNLDDVVFHTPRGRARAREGKAYVRAFLERLEGES